MNKIILSGGQVNLDKYIETTQIEVREDSILNAINLNNNLDLNIIIKENKSLTFNLFDYSIGQKMNLHIINEDGSKFVLNNSFISESDYELNIDNDLFGSDIETIVNIRGINDNNGNIKITMNGQVAGETKNNSLSEYAKIINKSDNSTILIPNLIVNSNDIVANHGVSIGNFNEEELFYIMSKGISRKTALKMLEEGFLLSIMDEKNKEIIKNILIGR